MKIKHLGFAILIMSITAACEQKTDSTKEHSVDENSTSQPQTAPSQQPQNPSAMPSAGSSVSDEELGKYVAASQYIQVITQRAQQEMVAAVEKEGLPAQRYTEIQQAQRNQNQDVGASAVELKQFEAASLKLQEIQVEAEQQMQSIITEEGLTPNRFQEISMTIQTNPEMQQKMRSIQEQNN